VVAAIIRGHVRTAASKRNAQRASNDDHPSTPMVGLIDDLPQRVSILDVADWRAVLIDCSAEFTKFDNPRVVGEWVFPGCRFRRTHLWQHFVEGEPFDSIASAKTVNYHLAVAAIDFERKKILPLGPAGVKPRHLPRGP